MLQHKHIYMKKLKVCLSIYTVPYLKVNIKCTKKKWQMEKELNEDASSLNKENG